MGRTLKRVPLNFDWTLGEVWEGYVNPHYKVCPDCESGYTPDGKWLKAIVYLLMMAGNAGIEARPLHPWLQQVALAPSTKPTPEMAKLTGGLAGRAPDGFIGHDAIDNWSAAKKIIEAAGLDSKTWGVCQACKGDCVDPSVREAYNAWKAYDPPTGEGYQLWENTSEGSPKSPVFKTLDELCEWCKTNATTFADYTATAEEWKRMLSEDNVYHQEDKAIFL